jgi:hypothetical protein
LPCDEYPELHDDSIQGEEDLNCDNQQKIPIDLDWEQRVVEAEGDVDMGAYEVQEGAPLCDPGQCPGDLNRDGAVDGADLLMLLSQWGECTDPCECPADLNCDETVDGADLLILLSNWGECSNPLPAFDPELLEDCYELYSDDPYDLLSCVFSSEELQSIFGGESEEQ